MRLVKRTALAAWMAALIALTLGILPGQAQVPVVVRIFPASAQVAAGGTVDVAVEVVDVQELYGFDVTVTFDPQVVEVVDADSSTPGIQVSQGVFLDPGFSVVNTADNAAGSVHFLTTQLNPSVAKSGTGALIVIKLRGKKAGASSALTVTDAQLARRDGFMIPATLSAGQIAVVSGGGSTNTPMPTQGAGTPMATTTPEPTALPTATLEPTGVPATATATVAASPTATSALPDVTATPMPMASLTPTPEAPAVTATRTAAPASATLAATPVPAAGPTAASILAAALSATPGSAVTVAAKATESPQGSPAAGESGINPWIAIGAGLATVALGAAAFALWAVKRRSAPR